MDTMSQSTATTNPAFNETAAAPVTPPAFGEAATAATVPAVAAPSNHLGMEADCAAAALAVCVLEPSAVFFEVFAYLKTMRDVLGLPPVAPMTAIVMFAQILLLRKAEGWSWHSALTVGASLACKSIFDDAFGLSDLTEVTKKYSLEALQAMECAAIKHVQLTRVPERLVKFRAGMVQVLLEQPVLLPHISNTPNASRVLVLDDDDTTRGVHISLLLSLDPDVEIVSCATLEEALPHILAVTEGKIDLALIDLQLDDQRGRTYPGEQGVLQPAATDDSGFAATTTLADPALSTSALSERPLHAGAPLIAMVTDRVNNAAQRCCCLHRGVDVVISKPLTVDALRPLLALGWGDRELPELAAAPAQAPAAAADVAPTGSPPQAVMGAA